MENEINENAIKSNNKKMLGFVLIVSIGFAVGGIIAGMGSIWGPYLYSIIGLQYYFRFNYEYLNFIPFTIWGVIGGLAIGIAAKMDRKLHMLLGGIGFGIGLVISVLLGAWSSGIAVAAVIIGILEGILLGFYYRNSKFIGILTVCGAAGFGVGGTVGTIIYKVILGTVSSITSDYIIIDLIRIIIGYIITGLMGGAALGYGTYYIKKLLSTSTKSS